MLAIKREERSQRKLQQVTEKNKMEYLIKNYLLGQVCHLKYDIDQETITILRYKEGCLIEASSKRKLEDYVVFYKVFKRYVQVSCSVVKPVTVNEYLLEVRAFKVAEGGRQYSRKLIGQDQISINKIRVAKNIINASLFKIPTSVKVHLQQYHQQIASMAEEVKVDVFDRKDPILELVRKSSKTFYVRDTQDINSYTPINDNDFVDYFSYLNMGLQAQMNEYRRNKVVSEVIVPILYVNDTYQCVPLGYFRLISKKQTIEMDTIIQLKAFSFEIIDKIRSSNTMLIDKKQNVVNISHAGLLLQIEDPELRRFLLHQGGFSFDVIFRLQQPVTVFARIVHTAEVLDGPLFTGVHIYGHSSRKNEIKRYHELVKNFEV